MKVEGLGDKKPLFQIILKKKENEFEAKYTPDNIDLKPSENIVLDSFKINESFYVRRIVFTTQNIEAYEIY